MVQITASDLKSPFDVHTQIRAERAIARVRMKFGPLAQLLPRRYALCNLPVVADLAGARWGEVDAQWLQMDIPALFLCSRRELAPAGMLGLATFGKEEWLWAVAVEGERRLWLRVRHTLALRESNPEGFQVMLSQVETAMAQWKMGARAVGIDRHLGEFDDASGLFL